MRIVVAVVGKPRDAALAAAIRDYEARATRYWPLEVREVREESGLEVVLLAKSYLLGHVQVLAQPYCILLENISPGHQHIDLIYFARVSGGALAPAEREARAARWYSWEDLADPEIAEDIRELGRRAIESYR